MFNTILYQPLLSILTFLTTIFGGSLGFAIIALTILIRTVLIPLSLPALKSAKKLKDLKPHLDNLKKKHAKDAKRLQQEQLNLYKEHGVNPAAGCLPTIAQFAVLIALYRVFIDFIQNGNGETFSANMSFLWFDLSKPDPFYILPVLAAGSQLLMSQMLMVGKEHHKTEELKAIKNKEKEESSQEMAETIQQQMLYVMPVMTGVIALSFPSGLAVYWVTTTIFSIVQQYVISGPGGLIQLAAKIKGIKEKL